MWANTTGAALQQRRFREAEADQPRRNAAVVDGGIVGLRRCVQRC